MGRPVAFNGPRGLVLLLQGVTREDVTCRDTTPELASLCEGQVPLALTTATGGETGTDAFVHALAIQSLRDSGLELDRRSWSLRPGWQSDRAMLDGLAQRPRGRADAVALWLRDAGRAATRFGIGSDGHTQALRDLDADVRRAVQLLRMNDRAPEVTLAFLDPLSPADRSFDPATALVNASSRRLRRSIQVRQSPAAMIVRCSNCRDLGRITEILRDAPFTNHGSLLAPQQRRVTGCSARPDEAWFLPAPRVAFGPRGTRAGARPFEDPGSRQCAIVPWQTTARSLHISELAAAWSQQLLRRLRPQLVRTPASVGSETAFPDLLSMLDAEVVQAMHLAERT